MKSLIILYFIIMGVEKPQGNTNVYSCVDDHGREYHFYTPLKHKTNDTIWQQPKLVKCNGDSN